jgi:hypothetical protein
MVAGLQIVNDYGTVQIDENYVCPSLVASGTLTCHTYSHDNWTKAGGSDETGATLTVTGTQPIVALAGDYYASIKSTTQSGSSWTFEIRTEPDAKDHAITYYVFDTVLSDASGVGLIVRDAAGNITYSSNLKPMRMVDILSGTLSSGWVESENDPYDAQSWTLPAGRSYAFVPGIVASYYHWKFADTGPFETWIEHMFAAKPVAGGLAAARVPLLDLFGSNHDSESGLYDRRDYSFLVLDVTNY